MRRAATTVTAATLAAVVAAACAGGASVANGTVRGTISDAGTSAGSAGRTLTGAEAAAGGAKTAVPSGNWTTFNYNRWRSGVGPASTGITASNVSRLRVQRVKLDGTVDASVVELSSVKIDGAKRPVIFFTTDYGQTEALDARSGKRLWQFTPSGSTVLKGSSQITTATPVIDPSHEFLYASSPTGYIYKLRISDGHRVWGRSITYDPTREKIAGALNISGQYLLTETDGYDGDAPPYQGHVVLIDRNTGRIAHVWNSLCSNIHGIIHPPSKCHASDSAIWGRPGAVIEPWSGNILVATGNGPFNGRTDWGDSVLELSPGLKLLHNWTPTNQQQLNQDDWDLGSTEPALLPVRHGQHYAVQGGKQGILQLLDLNRLDGTTGKAGPRTGGQLQDIDAPGPDDIFSQPAVWTSHGTTYVFVTDGVGTAAYIFDSHNRLRRAWHNGNAGTSPIIAGGLLYVYDENAGTLNVMNPRSGHVYRSLPAAAGHWNSPIAVGGRVFLPVGDDNDHQTTGELYIYHLPAVQ